MLKNGKQGKVWSDVGKFWSTVLGVYGEEKGHGERGKIWLTAGNLWSIYYKTKISFFSKTSINFAF